MLLLALVALFVSVSAAQASPAPSSCHAALAGGPPVPAPIVFRNSCGGFRLDRDGRMTRLPATWFARRSAGTGRTYGADLRLKRTRPGAYLISRKSRLVWRSTGLYRNDGGSVAFGPGSFAFAAYRKGIFLTDLRSPERQVLGGEGLSPIAFRRDGSLFVADFSAASIRIVARNGSLLDTYRYRRQSGYHFDEPTETLYFVTLERRLAQVDATGLRSIGPLGALDGWLGIAGPYLTLSDFAHKGSSDEIRYSVLRRDGALVSHWKWLTPKGTSLDYGPMRSPDGRTLALRTVTRDARRPVVAIHVVRAGETRPKKVLTHRARQRGCGVGVSFSWKGDSFLYSATDGPIAIVNARSGSVRDLSGLVRRLPRQWAGERASAGWLSDYGTR